MGAARKFRVQEVAEDAGDPCELYAPDPENTDTDALDHAVPPESLWPPFWCDDCGQHNEGQRLNCTYCGEWREDIDALS